MSWYKRAFGGIVKKKKKEREAKNEELFPEMISKQLSRCRDERSSVPFASSLFYTNITEWIFSFLPLDRLRLNSNKYSFESPLLDIFSLLRVIMVLLTVVSSCLVSHPCSPPTIKKERKTQSIRFHLTVSTHWDSFSTHVRFFFF